MRAVLRRLLVNPFAIVLLLVVLAAEARLVLWTNPVARELLARAGAASPVRAPEFTASAYFVRDGETIRRIDPDRESWDEATRIIDQRAGDMLVLVYSGRRRHSGLWAPTRVHESHALVASDRLAGSNFTPEQLRRARALFAGDLARHLSGPAGAALRERDYQGRRVLWAGYAHSLVTVAALAGFVLSLRWVPEAWARRRTRRRAAALAAGRCPRCAYPIAGLGAARCPECAEPLNSAS